MAEHFHQTPDFAIAPFLQGNAQAHAVALDGDHFDILWARWTILQFDALHETLQFLMAQVTVDGNLIGLDGAVARMLQMMSEQAVVGKDNQPLGIAVQASDGKDARVEVRDVIGKALAPRRVVHGRDDAARFIPQEINLLLLLQHRVSVHQDTVASGCNAHTEDAGLSIDSHAARADQLFRLTPCGDAGTSKPQLNAQRLLYATSTISSTSTGAFNGRLATPMALRAWWPRSPKTCSRISLAPFATLDCSVNSGVLAT